MLFRTLVLICLTVWLCACSSAEAPSPIDAASVLPLPAQASEMLPATPTLTPTETPLPSATAEAAIEPAPTQDAVYPSEHYITGIYGHKQYFSLGCEASVATDWAAFFGVTINEFNFQIELPLSDNPEKGFVGDVRGPWGQTPPYAYGVHAGPVADLLRDYGLPASAYKQMTIEQIKTELGEGHPLIAWVIGNVEGGVPAEYTSKDGETTIVAAYEHVVLVTGYNETTLRYNSNGKFYDVPIEVFANSWGVLGNMAIIYEEEKPVE